MEVPVHELEQSHEFVIIVPFRAKDASDPRAEHLIEFRAFVERTFGADKLWVVTQTPGKKFNRGMLLNVGFLQAFKSNPGLTHVILHDVDLIPSDELVGYYDRLPPPGRPLHLGKRFERYASNPEYLGGVLSIRTKDFLAINGFPNCFWGWGGEDDEFAVRVRTAGMTPCVPSCGSYRDLERLTLKQKVRVLQTTNDRCMIKHELFEDYRSGTLADDGVKSLNGTRVVGVSRCGNDFTVDLLATSGHKSDMCSAEAYATWGYPA
jgi:hypothetical protein